MPTGKSRAAVLTPFAAPSNTIQAKTALFRGFLVDHHRRIDGEFLPAGYASKSLPGHFVSPTAHQYKISLY